MKCKYRETRFIAQGDEGMWGKEWYCGLTGEICDEICPEEAKKEMEKDNEVQ